MERGTYTVYSERKLPKRKRRLPVKGTFEDRNRYQTCWNCGFEVDLQQGTGNPEFSGTYQEDAIIETQQRVGSGDQNTVTLGMELFGDMGVMLATGTTERLLSSASDYTPRLSLVSSGCPFCGCTNL